jgi:hypothetical protein
LLDQAAQRRAQDIFKISCGDAGTAQLQLGDDPPEEDAALLRR